MNLAPCNAEWAQYGSSATEGQANSPQQQTRPNDRHGTAAGPVTVEPAAQALCDR
jgi:hypothetical protein